MRSRKFEYVLKSAKITDNVDDFFLYWLDGVEYNQKLVTGGLLFLEGLFLKQVPYICSLVSKPDKMSERLYTGVYMLLRESWNMGGENNLGCYILNRSAYDLLCSELLDFQWIEDLDLEKLHRELNFYFFEIKAN